MRILIAGAGSIGSKLAENLAQEGHDVAVVEQNPRVATRLAEKLDILVVTGNAASPKVIESAGVEETDMLIALTDSDATNILVSLLGREYGVTTKIARIRSLEYTQPGSRLTPRDLGIDRVINPEQITIQEMIQLLEIPGSTEVADFGGGEVKLIGFEVEQGANIVGRSLAELKQQLSADPFLIVAILRDAELIIPTGHDRVQAHDKIYVFMPSGAQNIFLGLLTSRERQTVDHVQRVIIYGATRIGQGLAAAME